MKLSEAIRLGAMWTKQGFGPSGMGSLVAPCALGAALVAVGAMTEDYIHGFGEVRRLWPWMEGNNSACPECAHRSDSYVGRVVWHLNDTHEWTRERIAEWVATIEPQETPANVPEPVANNQLVEVTQ